MRKIAVIEVFPKNFNIKTEGEKGATIQVFRKFLNSLESPIQILIDTTTLDIGSYLNSLEKRVKKNGNAHMKLFRDFSEHLRKTIDKNSIRNRNFYIVIPEHSNIDIQIKVIEDRLNNLKLEHHRLETEQLKALMIKFFSGSGQGDIKEALQPGQVKNAKNCFLVDGKYNRVVCAYGYPRTVEAGFLDRIISAPGNFDISIHIEPYPVETMMVNLNRELQKQRADLYALEQRGIINPSLEIQYADTRNVLEELQKGNDKLFNVSLYINCKADTKEELDTLTKKVESELNGLMIVPKLPLFRMAQGFQSCAPLARDSLKITRNITASSLAAFYPFTSSFFKVDETGVWLGLNRNNIPIIRDIFKLSNFNGLIISSSGSGKSYFAKLLIARYLLNGCKVMVVDPQGEYTDLVKHFNGQHIKLSRTSKTMINPLDLIGHDYAEKRLSLMDLTQVMFGELTEPQKSFIDKALTQIYNDKGITDDPKTWNNQPPILSDLLEALEKLEENAVKFEKTVIRSLTNRLSMYVDGVFAFLNKHTNIDFNNQFVCFDIGDMPNQVKPLMMFLVLDYVYMKMRKDINRKLLVIDEAWSLLSRTEDAGYIFEIVKTCRKFNMGMLLINQEVEGLLDSPAGKSVLANSAYTILMRQKPAVIEDVQKTFHLSSAERDFLLTAPVGEGILLMEDDHSELKVIASEEEHRIITTNADERLANKETKEEPKEQKEVDIMKVQQKYLNWLDLGAFNSIMPNPPMLEEEPNEVIKPEVIEEQEIVEEEPAHPETPKVVVKVIGGKQYYRKSELGQPEIDYLLQNGYHESQQWDIETNKCESYLLKPRFNEGDSHLFLIYRIAEWLYKHTNNVWLFEVNNPDIIFEAADGTKVAIEVETGQIYQKKKKELLSRIERLNRRFGENWFFVVTNKEAYWKYKKLGKTYLRKNVIIKLRYFFPETTEEKATPPPEMAIETAITPNSPISGGGENSL